MTLRQDPTIAMIRCPYAASSPPPDQHPDQHPDGMHHCTHLIPAGGDHLGEHACACGVVFVVRAPKAVPRPAAGGLVYLLWSQSHTAWWRHRASGYTDSLDEAGRFTEAEAVRHVVASAASGIRDRVTFMVAAPDNWTDRSTVSTRAGRS